jgi:hypothetical protein
VDSKTDGTRNDSAVELRNVKQMALRSKVQRQLFFRLVLGVALMVILAACGIMQEKGPGQVRRWPSRPWSDAFVYRTPHYAVRTNTSSDVSMYIGELMEKAAAGYCAVLGCEYTSLPALNIHAYATRKEYETVVRRLGLPSDITTGLYSPVPPAAIHLPYIRDLKVHPSVTLLHEGVHQFVDQVIRFRVPAAARGLLPQVRHALLSLPLWLNEGLATYMEGAVVREGRLEIGRINQKRLVHLQKLIRKGKCPPLRKVLARPYGEAFMAEDYAVAWGIVYALRHSQGQPDNRKRLTRYVEACRQAFYTDPAAEFMKEFLPDMRPVEGFEHLWAEHIARRSLEVVEEVIVEEVSTLDAWERDWTARILELNAGEPYGGFAAGNNSRG